MASVLDLIKHYQHSIEKNPNDEQRILRCIDKLHQLGVTVQHLQDTGVGRTVNALRKEPGDVGTAARALVNKWKLMVAAEESSEPEDNDTSKYNGHNSGKDSDESVNQSRHQEPERKDEVRAKSSNYEHSNGDHSNIKRKYHSSEDEEYKNKKTKYPLPREDEKYDQRRDSKVKLEQSSNESDNDTNVANSDNEQSEMSDESECEAPVTVKVKVENTNTDSPNSSKQSYSHRSEHKKSSSNQPDKNNRSSEKHSKHQGSSEKPPTNEKPSSSKHNSSSDNKNSEKHKSKNDDTIGKLNKSFEKPTSKSDKHKSHRSEKHDKSDNQLNSSQTHKSQKEQHRSSGSKERSSMDKKSKESRSKEKSSSSSKDRSKDRSSSSKEKSSHSNKNKDNKKHSSSRDSKSKSSDSKSKSDKAGDSSSEKEYKQKSSSSSTHKSNKSSKVKEDVPKKKKTQANSEDSEDGIDCGSGASFAEALGMLSPAKPKKKSLGKDTNDINFEQMSPASLLAPTAKLMPLPPLEISALPEISPNYKPRPPPKLLPHLAEEDTMGAAISSKNLRTKVYSGNKTYGKLPSLYELCVQVLQENIDALEYTGGVPYDILKPVVDKASPDQLFILEHYNPYLMEDTDHLWQKHCERHFRNKKRQEMETWREMYMRCQEEQEYRLKSLTANIKMAQDAKNAPVKQTKMAYVDSVVKPPRSIARKQAIHGTARTASASPAARVAALAGAANVARLGTARPPPAAPSAALIGAIKPKKAPLMQKALQFMRGRKR